MILRIWRQAAQTIEIHISPRNNNRNETRRRRWFFIGDLVMKKLIATGLILPVLLLAAGCDKEIKLTFLNSSSQSLDLKVTPPGKGTVDLGTLIANGGMLKYQVKVEQDDLPATCFWKAGHHSGQVLVAKASPKAILVEIRAGGPGDKRDVIKKKTHIDVKDTLIDEKGPVVE